MGEEEAGARCFTTIDPRLKEVDWHGPSNNTHCAVCWSCSR